MKKLLQSDYRRDPRFAPSSARQPVPPQPACAPREFRYVEPSRKDCRERDRRPDGPRSGLAYASGYAGLVYLLRYSVIVPLSETLGLESAAAFLIIFTWGLSAPLAVTLGVLAGRRLDRTQGLRGKLPALTGFTLGVLGTVNLWVEWITWWSIR